MPARTVLAIALAGLMLASCAPDLRGTAGYERLKTAVEHDLTVFEGDEIPDSMLELLARHRVVLVGEYHDISGHNELVGELATSLQPQGFNTVLLEFPQSYSWLLDGYSRGILDTPGEGAMRTYGPLLDRIREANAALPAQEQISVWAIDVNPGVEDFLPPFRGIMHQLGQPDPLSGFVNALDAGADYAEALWSLRVELEADADLYREGWGDRAYELIAEMLYAEHRSIEVRAERNATERDRLREEVMKSLTERQLASARGGVLINVGYFHAQKRRQFGTVDEWLGQYLIEESPHAREQTFALVVAPASGEKRIRGRVESFDVTHDSPENELFRIMSELAGGKTAFLPLDAELFATEKVVVNYLPELATTPPKEVFDGFVLLPEVQYTGR